MSTAPARFPPGPSNLVPLRNLFALRRDPLGYLTRLARTYGDIAHFEAPGRGHVFVLNRPDYIRDVLVTHAREFEKGIGLKRAKRLLGEGLLTSEGDFHLRQRRLAQPAFHRERVRQYGRVMAEYAQRASARWDREAPGDGKFIVDIHVEMMRLTMAIAGKTLFGADVESEAGEIRQALADSMDLFNRITMPYGELIERLLVKSRRRFERAKATLDGIIYRMIEERRRTGEDRGDLLSMLLLARDTEADNGRMTDRQLRDECMTIFLAGHETTANALAWTFYLLSRNPDAEQELHDELERVLRGRAPVPDDVPALRYTEMVVAEAMRLYPPAWVVGRTTLRPYTVDGYVIPKGSLILMSEWVMHRDPRYFADPERFDPHRWEPEARERRPKFSYFPFGGGPRVCIGEPFAWMEAILVLATLAPRWRMRLVPGHPVVPRPLITLRPKFGMRMELARR